MPSTPSFDLTGKVALVTGASRGIGAAAVRALSGHGAVVGINCFPSSTMRAAADGFAAEVAGHGGSAIVLPADITDRRGVVEMFEKCEKDLGPIDVLITNAADLGDTPWDDLDLAGWESMLRVNSTGKMFLCAQAAYETMRARAGGVIITVSSATVELGHGASVPYITSKGGGDRIYPCPRARGRPAQHPRQFRDARRDRNRGRPRALPAGCSRGLAGEAMPSAGRCARRRRGSVRLPRVTGGQLHHGAGDRRGRRSRSTEGVHSSRRTPIPARRHVRGGHTITSGLSFGTRRIKG